ncbi:RNB domain-containing ribonuclease [Corynebacterium sp. LK28]|uniref:RNB domain-containing ribonuclease n=1 Tax=Corynebacterium TaxID=1716 RepID=UPI0005570B8F|nr:RNB domain-containing ribonuclease [Corynebacterium sp. LK28]MBC6794214.1 RNB domain-containing ribonuclease [Corynebacterium sp. LK28]
MKLFAAELNFRTIAEEFELPEHFPEDVHAEALHATDRYADQRRDLLDVPFVTIDPAGSMDLDQAVNIQDADGAGGVGAAGGAGGGADPAGGAARWRVRYAIADVAAFVDPAGALMAESLQRGQTMYLPDEPTRLHPAELSEGSASLLPDQTRPAVVWDILLHADGEVAECTVYRALIRSVKRFDYTEVEADMKRGTLHPAIAQLPEVGRARQSSDLRRKAINLRLPSISVERTESDDGTERYVLDIDERLEMNDFNSELSLLAGMCAGEMMVRAGVGILRTLPPAGDKEIAAFDNGARALGFDRSGRSIGELLADIDASTPRGMALMRDAQTLLRGAGYQHFGLVGEDADAEPSIHAGIGGHYAHVTAPLRRLVDRFATEVCLAIANSQPIPEWVTANVDQVLSTMKSSGQTASAVDRACLNLTEAVVLQPWVGQNFNATVLHSDGADKAKILVEQPPILTTCVGGPDEASTVKVTLVIAEPAARKVRFAWPAD